MEGKTSGMLKAIAAILAYAFIFVIAAHFLAEAILHDENPKCQYAGYNGYPDRLYPPFSNWTEDNYGRIIEYDISSMGFRDREYTFDKPSMTYRIISLGDSFTFGQGVGSDETYAKILESLLAGHNASRYSRFEVINMGVQGYNTRDEVQYFMERGSRLGPDLVIIGYVPTNDDLDSRIQEINDAPTSLLLQGFSLIDGRLCSAAARKIAESRYSSQSFSASGFKKYVGDPLAQIGRAAATGNYSVIAFNYNGLAVDSREYLPLQEALNNSGIIYIDMNRIFDGHNITMQLSERDPHPSGIANRLVAERLNSEISRMIDDR
jgi:hypothetical protein